MFRARAKPRCRGLSTGARDAWAMATIEPEPPFSKSKSMELPRTVVIGHDAIQQVGVGGGGGGTRGVGRGAPHEGAAAVVGVPTGGSHDGVVSSRASITGDGGEK